MKFRVSLIVATLLTFAIGSARTAYAAPPQACSLLTQAQVSVAVGVLLGPGKEAGALNDCQWSEPSKPLAVKGVELYVLGPVGSLTPAQRFDTIKMPLPVKGITKTPVSGVGDDAVYGTIGPRTELTVKKGDSVFQIRVYGLPEEDTKAKEKALAQDVLAKL
ncbi:MAG: hypothetical protein ACREQ5_07915 [Candidatus Dormibacteria bacterium]